MTVLKIDQLWALRKILVIRGSFWSNDFQILDKFDIPNDKLLEMSQRIQKEMEDGLAKQNGGSVAMLPSFVPALPDGTGRKLKRLPSSNSFFFFF